MTARALDANSVTALVADAAAAPPPHNAQPWAFHFLSVDGVLRLRSPCGGMRSAVGSRRRGVVA
ncbi:hypothetical protein [Streptomyces sp. NPDC046197]|uniref:hypothetical protein n=1 Tax=Streptomyces sp. NPDC046197 TaxID=3154337 RepID=UPI0033DF645C